MYDIYIVRWTCNNIPDHILDTELCNKFAGNAVQVGSFIVIVFSAQDLLFMLSSSTVEYIGRANSNILSIAYDEDVVVLDNGMFTFKKFN